MTTTHVNSIVDVYAGADTGSNTTWGQLGENNDAIGGIGLNLMDGNLTVLALTHFGPEQATRLLSPLGVNANGQWRHFNDVMVTWKASDALMLVTVGNLVRDGFGAAGRPVNGFGIVRYASYYALTDTVALNGRVEYWRDDNSFFVASFPGNSGPVMVQQGFAVTFPSYRAWYEYHLRNAYARSHLEARAGGAGVRVADPSGSALGPRSHRQPPVQCTA
jgi:Putative beta-barrel porin-2, OmpL-like. bbp2